MGYLIMDQIIFKFIMLIKWNLNVHPLIHVYFVMENTEAEDEKVPVKWDYKPS